MIFNHKHKSPTYLAIIRSIFCKENKENDMDMHRKIIYHHSTMLFGKQFP